MSHLQACVICIVSHQTIQIWQHSGQ